MKKIFTIYFLFMLGAQLVSGQEIISGKSLSSGNFTSTLEKVTGLHAFSMKSIVAKQTEGYAIDTLSSQNPIFYALLADRQKPRFEQISFLPVIQRINIKAIPILQVCDTLAGIRAIDNKVLEVPQNRYIAYGATNSVFLSAGYGARQKASAQFHITHRTRKLALFADYNFQHNHFRQVFHNYRKVDYQNTITHTWDTITRNPLLQQHALYVGMEYTLSSTTKVSGLLSGFSNTVTVDDEAIRTNMLQGNQATTPVYLTHQEKNQWRHLKGILSLTHQFSKEQEMNIELGFLHYHANNVHQFAPINLIVSENTSGSDPFTIHRKIPIGVKVGGVTYTKNFSKQSKLEAGLKGTMASLGNYLNLERFKQDQWQQDSAASYQMNRLEYIGAAYLAIHHQLNAKTKLHTSLRWEYSHAQVHKARHIELVQRRNNNLLPSLSLSREFSQGRSLQVSYARSLNRPTYNNLAAYIFPTDAFSGNMSLRPSIVDALAATFQLKEKYQVSLGYNYHKNSILPLQFHVNPQTNQQYAQAENLKNIQNYYLTFSFQSNIAHWWQLQSKIYGSWQRNRILYEGIPLQAQKIYGNFQIVNILRLPHDYSAEITGFYQTMSLYGVGYLKAFGGLNISVQKHLRNNLGVLKLTADDIFGTMGIMVVNHQPRVHLNQAIQGRFVEPRIFRLTYSHTFGNLQVKRVPLVSNICEEEGNRAIK